jgi:tRNA-specific 2-thiouridylase
VADKIPSRNALIVVQDPDHPLLLSDAFDVEQTHWITSGAARLSLLECAVKTRYRQSDLECKVSSNSDAGCRVTLSRPARAVTPGQYAVFYRGDRCLGGGIIARRFNSERTPATQRIAYNSHFSVEGP